MLKGFVVGTGRSGTTLLINLLGFHSQLSPLYELEFLLNILTWYNKNGTIVSSELLGLLNKWGSGLGGLPFVDIWDRNYDKIKPRFGSKYARFTRDDLMLAGRTFLDELRREPAERALARFITRLSDMHARSDGKPHCIIKTPAVMNAPALIFGALPAIKFIHIFRDGRDVWCSIRNYSWGPGNLIEAARWWVQHMRLADELRKILPDRLLEIQYETLLDQPQEELDRAINFLELEPESISHPLVRSSVHRHRGELSREEVAKFNEIAGDVLRQRGYEVDR